MNLNVMQQLDQKVHKSSIAESGFYCRYSNCIVKLWNTLSRETCIFQPSNTALIIDETAEEGTIRNEISHITACHRFTAAAYSHGTCQLVCISHTHIYHTYICLYVCIFMYRCTAAAYSHGTCQLVCISHTHTHTYIIHIYVCMCVSVCIVALLLLTLTVHVSLFVYHTHTHTHIIHIYVCMCVSVCIVALLLLTLTVHVSLFVYHIYISYIYMSLCLYVCACV